MFFLIFMMLSSAMTMAIDTLSFENCENLQLDCEGANPLLPLGKQKEEVMRMLFKDKPLPAFDYITFWNDYNPYYSTPEGIEPQSAGSINNSFVMISAADHSVVDKGIEYGAEKGRIVVQYGYNLSVPEDDIAQEGSVCSTGEPGDYFGGPKENKLGECATKYTNSKDRTYLEVSQDGVKISAGPREEYDYARLLRYPYTLSKQSRFDAKVNIIHDLTTEHYEWE